MTPLRLLLVLLAPVLSLSGPGAALFGDDLVGEAIRKRIEAYREGERLTAGGEPILEAGAVTRFYRERAFGPAWTADLSVLARADSVIAAVRRADADGLTPAHYHVEALGALRERARGGAPSPGLLAELELLATDAFVRLGRHLAEGRADPRRVDPEWRTALRGADVEAALRRAVIDDRPAEVLRSLAPTAPEYQRLRALLARLRTAEAEGSREPFPDGETLRPGDRHPHVAVLRRRLAAERRVHPGAPDPSAAAGTPEDVFDGSLEAAVRDFQERHGLVPDGAVGTMTRAALAVPLTRRISQVRANLERWRWLVPTLGERHVRVNIAGFRVDVFEGDAPVLRMRAIVGQSYRETPIFSDRIRYVVFAPYWNVPPGIAAKDKLPEIKRDPGWLTRQGMTLFEHGTGRRVDPATVDWARMSGAAFNRRFWLRQDPGPLNALGAVKFMFPNRYNVYLHDTPTKYLFDRAVRDFSSGCIRVEKPVELARWLLGDAWPVERVRSAMAGRRENRVDLPEPVPVHVLYLTATVDPDGRPYFFDDVYGRDLPVVEALTEGPDRPPVRPVGDGGGA